MSLPHRSTDTHTDGSVTDVMGSEASGIPTQVKTNRRGEFGNRETQTETRMPRASVGLIIGSFIALLLSAWAGIVPFVGPTFGFSADGTSSWTWNHVHALGALLPGVVGVLACMLLLVSARRPRDLQSSVALGTWGFVLLLCGTWLTVTPVVWPAIAGIYFHAASPTMTLAYWLGYASGPGVLLASFGAFVMGRAGRRTAPKQIVMTRDNQSEVRDDQKASPSMV